MRTNELNKKARHGRWKHIGTGSYNRVYKSIAKYSNWNARGTKESVVLKIAKPDDDPVDNAICESKRLARKWDGC